MTTPACGYFVLKRTEDRRFLFEFKSAEHVVLLRSRPHITQADARYAIETLRESVRHPACFGRRRLPGGEHVAELRSTLGRLIGLSTPCASPEALEGAIARIVAQCPQPQADITLAGMQLLAA